MKKPFLLFIFFLLIIFNVKGQNLVPNGGFEDTVYCPISGVLNAVSLWTNPTWGDPNYYNSCNPYNNYSVPSNNGGFGYQYAHSGNAYCGIQLKYIITPVDSQRDYIEVPLISTLIANQCYHFEMYVNLWNESKYTTDAIGAYFSDTLVTGVNSWHALPFIPQIENNSGNFFDTLNWTLVSGEYMASGGENYLIIGNYKSEFNTTLIQINNVGSELLVFIDDVSLVAAPCTAIEEQNENDAIKIYPNPVKDEFKVSGLKFKVGEKAEIIITDVLGKEIYRNEVKTSDFKLQTLNYKPGIYFIEINDGKNIFRKKFLKE